MTIELIPLRGKNTLTDFVDKEKPFCICDFYLEGCEKGVVHPDHIKYEGILNIDHHAPRPEFKKYISSTNMAISYVKKNGTPNIPIIINHTDCDSILSSHIMNGYFAPEDIWGEAAIAADHTGIQNDIADLLQATQEVNDWRYSCQELLRLLEGNPYEPRTQQLLQKRQDERNQAKMLVPSFKYDGNIAYCSLDTRVDSAFLPPELPNAQVILLGIPMSNGKLEVKVRLGLHAQNIDLNALNLPDFGGRWNAGSTKRVGGTNYTLTEYAALMKEKVDKLSQ